VEHCVQLTKLEAARRQLETAIKLYFADGDEVSIHALAAASYSLVRDINQHLQGEPMLKDLHRLLPDDLAREFRTYINRPENFFKHADKDPDEVGELEPKWTEVLIWEASRKYCEITGEQNRLLITFIFWFVARQPQLRELVEKECLSQGFTKQHLERVFQLPSTNRKRFFEMLN
jgi:hypothetical protein